MPRFQLANYNPRNEPQLPKGYDNATYERGLKAAQKATGIGPVSRWEQFKTKVRNTIGGLGIPSSIGNTQIMEEPDVESPEFRRTDLQGQILGLAAGFLPPAARRMSVAQHISDLTDFISQPGRSLDEIKKAQALADAIKKYPHLIGHMEKYDTTPSLDSLLSGSAADFHPGDIPVKELKARRNLDLAGARSLVEKEYPFSTDVAANPRFPMQQRLVEDLLNRATIREMPRPKFDLGLYSPDDPARSVRHELGHGAMALSEQKSAPMEAYKANTDLYGYNLNPAEIRARAIANKDVPLIRTPGQTYGKNSYMNRIYESIVDGLKHTKDSTFRKDFQEDFSMRKMDFPDKFYDYIRSPQNIDKYYKIASY